jgi:hypothetical protein
MRDANRMARYQFIKNQSIERYFVETIPLISRDNRRGTVTPDPMAAGRKRLRANVCKASRRTQRDQGRCINFETRIATVGDIDDRPSPTDAAVPASASAGFTPSLKKAADSRH